MKLSKEILDTLRGYTATMEKDVSFVLQTGEHDRREELAAFLAEIAGTSEKIRF